MKHVYLTLWITWSSSRSSSDQCLAFNLQPEPCGFQLQLAFWCYPCNYYYPKRTSTYFLAPRRHSPSQTPILTLCSSITKQPPAPPGVAFVKRGMFEF
ncbi:hypothetical protein DFH29DRAFT_925518 [Suillus ampliporus]|nr:hypothetical protein DFH29DRAFT_925518 [Suillus ampliporus]